MSNQTRPEPTAEMIKNAQQLLTVFTSLNRMRPDLNVQTSLKGLPAVMEALNDAGEPLSPSELAQRTNVTDARIANILRVLQERGYVERKQSETDKRRAEITLTDAGTKACAKGKHDAETAIAGFLTEFGEENTLELIRLMKEMLSTVKRLRQSGKQPPEPIEVTIMKEGDK